MRMTSVVLAVRDIERSRKFYEQLFDQKVNLDFGENISFEGGLSLQEGFTRLLGLSEETRVDRSHNMELYFEVEDFDQTLDRLSDYGSIDYVHRTKIYPWRQRVIRIYDPDGHIIEIGESMRTVAGRLREEGFSIEETAEITQHPESIIRLWCAPDS